jgi:7-cyano-7-deazaguanine synthase
MDSAALAQWTKPEFVLFIDYGQEPAAAERRAARRVSVDLGLPWAEMAIDCRSIGAGLLADRFIAVQPPTGAWWPYRNQLIVTFASAWAIARGGDEILIGTVATDGAQHRDGTSWFVQTLDTLMAGQEGGVRVRAPAIAMTTEELIAVSGISRTTIGATYSCHTGVQPCGDCGGCAKREDVFAKLG